MADVHAATITLLEEKSEIAADLEAMLAVDAEQDNWTFDDVPIDSGAFGEIVARDIVRDVDGAYQLRDPDAVRAALQGEAYGEDAAMDIGAYLRRPQIDIRAMGALILALAFLFSMRILQYPSVMREEHVVSPANDPYFYRYMMGELLDISTNPWSTEVIAHMPARALSRRPFTHAANWWIAAFLGGDAWATDVVAAWLPVVGTMLLGLILYRTATVLTNDVRVGLATIFVLALTPMHAVYAGLGFLEHRLHQYLWLGVTLLSLTYLAIDVQRRREHNIPIITHLRSPWSWLAAAGLIPGLAFSVLAWGGSVMYLLPFAGYLGLRVAMDVRAGVSPIQANLPLALGGTIGALLIALLHFRWAWHDPYVAYIALLMIAGIAGVLVLGEVWRIRAIRPAGLVLVQALGAGSGLVAFYQFAPDEWAALRGRIGDVFTRDTTAIESSSLFAQEFGYLFGPIFQIGVDFLVALAVLGWAALIIWRGYHPGWLVFCVYAVVWLFFASFQARFGAQLAIVLAVPAGLGLVYFLAAVDLVRPPRPFRDDEEPADAPSIAIPQSAHATVYLVAMILLIGGVSLAFVPMLGADVTHSDTEYATMQAIEQHAIDSTEQEPYILSNWGDNRMYNHLVYGEGNSYGYAARNYESFIIEDDTATAYADYAGDVGYIVIHEQAGTLSEDSVYQTLHGGVDPAEQTLPDTGHFQALALNEEVSAFALVPGATIEANESDSLLAETEVTLDDTTFAYERSFEGADNVTVAYPGSYTVNGETVEVNESAVLQGETISLS